MSQQRIDGVLSVDLRPKGFRSGEVGTATPYLVLLRDLRPRGSSPTSWAVRATIEPPTPGLSVGFPRMVTLPVQKLTGRRPGDPEAVVYCTEPAVPDTEVQVVLTFTRGKYVITVRRYFTVEPTKPGHRPR